jgi:DNA invertase Pin-like site-specific DNA recombinase
MEDLTIRRARELLTSWAAEQAVVAARRDEVVRTAVAAGVSKSEVHRLTRIARSTIDRIIAAGGEA